MLLLLMLLPLYNIAQTQPFYHISWKIAAKLPPPAGAEKALGIAGALAGIHQNVLMVGGGANFPDGMPWLGGAKKYHTAFYLFAQEGACLRFLKTAALPFASAYGASASTPQGIIYAGGENEKGILNQVWLMQWNAQANEVTFQKLPPLPEALTNASITSDSATVYIGGGEGTGGVSNRFYKMDLHKSGQGWQQLASLPKPLSHAVMVLVQHGVSKKILLIGGRNKNKNGISDLSSAVYAYDVLKDEWTEKKALPYALSAGTGVAAGTDHVFLFGGDKGATFHQTELLIAAINAEKDTAKKAALNQQKSRLQSSHPGFSREVLQYNIADDSWFIHSTIAFQVPVTTTAVLHGNKVYIPSGEIKAGVRTPQILLATISTNH